MFVSQRHCTGECECININNKSSSISVPTAMAPHPIYPNLWSTNWCCETQAFLRVVKTPSHVNFPAAIHCRRGTTSLAHTHVRNGLPKLPKEIKALFDSDCSKGFQAFLCHPFTTWRPCLWLVETWWCCCSSWSWWWPWWWLCFYHTGITGGSAPPECLHFGVLLRVLPCNGAGQIIQVQVICRITWARKETTTTTLIGND